MSHLTESQTTYDIAVLVRAEDHEQATQRVAESLQSRQLPLIELHPGWKADASGVSVLATDLTKDDLDIGAYVYKEVVNRAVLVIHVRYML